MKRRKILLLTYILYTVILISNLNTPTKGLETPVYSTPLGTSFILNYITYTAIEQDEDYRFVFTLEILSLGENISSISNINLTVYIGDSESFIPAYTYIYSASSLSNESSTSNDKFDFELTYTAPNYANLLQENTDAGKKIPQFIIISFELVFLESDLLYQLDLTEITRIEYKIVIRQNNESDRSQWWYLILIFAIPFIKKIRPRK